MNPIYCDIHPLPGESFIDACVRITPLRQRVLSGLALKTMCIRMHPENYPKNEDQRIKIEFDKINQMTDEEYEEYSKGGN